MQHKFKPGTIWVHTSGDILLILNGERDWHENSIIPAMLMAVKNELDCEHYIFNFFCDSLYGLDLTALESMQF